MIKARHNPFFVRFFQFYSRFMIYNHFKEVRLKGEFRDKGKPVLLIGNHFSWWDGFIANYLNSLVFDRTFHVMMLEDQLDKRMFLNKAGAYSIRKNSRSAIESLSYTKDLLSDSHNLVTIYPQGEIQSLYHYPVSFQKGIVNLIQGLEDQIQVIFLAALVDYFSSRKPSLTLGLVEYHPDHSFCLEHLQKAYNKHLQKMIENQKEDVV